MGYISIIKRTVDDLLIELLQEHIQHPSEPLSHSKIAAVSASCLRNVLKGGSALLILACICISHLCGRGICVHLMQGLQGLFASLPRAGRVPHVQQVLSIYLRLPFIKVTSLETLALGVVLSAFLFTIPQVNTRRGVNCLVSNPACKSYKLWGHYKSQSFKKKNQR